MRCMDSVFKVLVELDFHGFEELRLLGEEFLVDSIGCERIECLTGSIQTGEFSLPDERVAWLGSGNGLHAPALRQIGAGTLKGRELAFEFEEFFFFSDIELLEDAHGDRHDGRSWS